MTNARRHFRAAMLFIAPWALGMAAFALGPLAMSLYYSLCDYSVLTPPVFIGAGNFTDLMGDDLFFKSVRNTLGFATAWLPISTALALGLALLLNCQIVARPFFRAVFFLPSLVPLVALAVLWGWIFNGNYGVLNYALSFIGLDGPNWLGDPDWTKPAILICGLWGVGNAVVIYLAALQDIPQVYYDAARVDGAGPLQQLIHVTLPMLTPAIYFNVLMSCITVLQIFAVPYVLMPTGGPGRSTLFYSIYLFDRAFTSLDMGYACAMAWLLFFAIATLTWTAHRIMKKRVYYGGG